MRSSIPFYLLCFTVWFLPIPLGANRPWAWGLIEVLIAFTSFLICFSYSFNEVLSRLRPIKWLFFGIGFIQFWIFFQWLGGLYPSLSLLKSLEPSQTEIALIKGISYCLFIFNLAFLIHSQQRAIIFIKVLMVSGLTQALYAIYLQYSGIEYSVLGYEIGTRANGSFVYSNHLASFLVLCISIAIGYLFGSLKGSLEGSNRARIAGVIDTLLSEKWVVRIAIVIMVVALIMTRSRMGNSVFFMSLLVVSGLALVIMKRPPNTLKWLVASLVILDLAIVGSYFGVEKVKERIESTSLQAETRDDVVIASIPYIKDFWLIGSGAGTFYSTFQQYQPTFFHNVYDHAHNEYIQLLAELGIIPCIILTVILAASVYRCVQTIKHSRNPHNYGIAMGGLMACLAVSIHSVVDFILQSFCISLTFLSIVYLIFAHGTYKSRERCNDK